MRAVNGTTINIQSYSSFLNSLKKRIILMCIKPFYEAVIWNRSADLNKHFVHPKFTHVLKISTGIIPRDCPVFIPKLCSIFTPKAWGKTRHTRDEFPSMYRNEKWCGSYMLSCETVADILNMDREIQYPVFSPFPWKIKFFKNFVIFVYFLT